MKKKSFLLLLTFFSWSILLSQSVTNVFDVDMSKVNYSRVFLGDKYSAGTSCHFNKGKGMLTLFIEVQADNTASWGENKIAIKYGNGNWIELFDVWAFKNSTAVEQATYNPANFTAAGSYVKAPTTCPYPLDTWSKYAPNETYKIGAWRTDGERGEYYIRNYGNLEVYNGSYNPLPSVDTRTNIGQNDVYSLQTVPYTSYKGYPVGNPADSSGVQAFKYNDGSKWYVISHATSQSNLPGVMMVRETTIRSFVVVNLTNLPPEMLESNGFRVHLYQNSNTAHDRIYEWVYNETPNFMTNAPVGLSATKDLCGQVKLTWSNSYNALPNDGEVHLKTVVFRNGIAIGTVDYNTTEFTDNAPSQDIEYEYSVRHIAFSESWDTYYRTPESVRATGYVLPSPPIPISLEASLDRCDGTTQVKWQYNDVNPKNFRIQDGISTYYISGAKRDTTFNITRGSNYNYYVRSTNKCNVLSTTQAVTSGFSISDPTAPTAITATYNGATNAVDFVWRNNGNNETKFQVQRQDDLGNLVTFDLNKNNVAGSSFTFSDDGISSCRNYDYSIKAFNSCVQSGVISNVVVSGTVPPVNISNSFNTTDKKLIASKGYFNNRVELQWSNDNNNNIDLFKIYRKKYGSSDTPSLIGTAAAGSGNYIDNTADANIYYEYSIFGEKYCDGATLVTNTSTDLGFRSPYGIINGHIEYEGGIAVKGVEVNAENTATIPRTAAHFDGTNHVYTPHTSSLIFGSEFSIDLFANSALNANGQYLLTKPSDYSLILNGTTLEADFIIGGVSKKVSYNSFTQNTYHQVGINYDGSFLKLTINGLPVDSIPASGPVQNSGSALYTGISYYGQIDELRLFNASRDSAKLFQNHNQVLNGDEGNIVLIYHFDEGTGDFAFDQSKTGSNYNANHGTFIAGSLWSSNVPTQSQLGYRSYTDNNGDYTISGIRFFETGSNYKVTPILGTHVFNPSNKVLFLGDNNFVHNGIDFIDKSSFKVSGYVVYANRKYNGGVDHEDYACKAKDIWVYIDNEVVIRNNEVVKTDATGYFEINVPIGNHIVSVGKTGHNFSRGRFPMDTTWDFQKDLDDDLTFIDSTFLTVAGRVVGGTVEQSKPRVFPRSINNVGQAEIIFSHITGCLTDTVYTIDSTGEYSINLPPLKYHNPRHHSWGANSKITFINKDVRGKQEFNDNSEIDLSIEIPEQTEIDSVFIPGNPPTLSHVDSLKFHVWNEFILRNKPEIQFYNADNSNVFKGEQEYIYSSAGVADTLDVSNLNTQVFLQNNTYNLTLKAVEKYINEDTKDTSYVPVTTGVWEIRNNIGTQAGNIETIYVDSATTPYSFSAGNPQPISPFTKKMTVKIEYGSNGTRFTEDSIVGFVSGNKSIDGQSFISTGPAVVEYVLRDPPGSNSTLSLETGSVITTSKSFSIGRSTSNEITSSIKAGAEFSTGIGLEVKTEINADVSIAESMSVSSNSSGELTEEITTNNKWSTSSSAETPGAMSDVYIGKSMNINFGVANRVELIPDSVCAVGGKIECGSIASYSKIDNHPYRFGRRLSLQLAPAGYGTEFTYEQNHIINYLIPRLKLIRNEIFTDPANEYFECYSMNQTIKDLGADHELFAVNNDAPVISNPAYAGLGITLSSLTPTITEDADYGSSATLSNSIYFFDKGKIKVNGKECYTDTVRWFNQQIRLWEEAIARNEEEKAKAIKVNNRSFSSGIATEWSQTTSTTESYTIDYETSIDKQTKLEVSAEVNGVGLGLDNALSISMNMGSSSSNSTTNSTTWAYTLYDENQGDFFSVDIKESKTGNSPIFALQAGESECPWEEATYSQYYRDPSAPFTPVQLAGGTISRQNPEILVDNQPTAERINVPSNGAAEFTLQLFNVSPFDNKQFGVEVIQNTNPDGARLFIGGNGSGDAVNVTIGANGVVEQSLSLYRGPGSVYRYDSIGVIIKSLCQYDYGTSNVRDIADTIYVSAEFIPDCEKLEIMTPFNNWVLNNSFDDTMFVGVNEYDINNSELKNIKIEYKPSNSTSWTNIETWWKSNQLTLSPNPDTVEIPVNSTNASTEWAVESLPDGYYDLRATSTCIFANEVSEVFSGVIDRINPHPFGTPSPADGILSPEDDIFIQFNESIDIGELGLANFDLRGVLNGAELRHDAYLYFDGVDDYVKINRGLDLKSSSTVEMWIKRNNLGTPETFFSQGINANQSYSLSFNASNFIEVEIAGETYTSTTAVSDNYWHHIAVAYNEENGVIEFVIDGSNAGTNNNFLANYTEGGDVYIGKSSHSSQTFDGFIHELRIWDRHIPRTDIASRVAITLSGREFGIVGLWPMDEAIGLIANDKARNRHAEIHGAIWSINPSGESYQFDGSSHVEYNSSTVAFTNEMDFSIEFWFNGATPSDSSTLFSNGSGKEPLTWSIYTDASGKLFVKHNNEVTEIVSENVMDGTWHHLAIVLRRTSNTSFYIDGDLSTSFPSNLFNQFGSAKVYLGARGYMTNLTENIDQYFNGYLDDIRVWNLSRKQEQIRRDRVNRLLGDEYGLEIYLPFEDYTLVNSQAVLSPTLSNIVNGNMATSYGGASESNNVPTIKLPRPITSIPLTYSVNDDKIIITPNIDPARIENVTLDITVSDVEDLNGNKLQSPKTWIAYIDKNQVVWENTEHNIDIELEGTYTFNENILNIGGQLKEYSITNLPYWLTVNKENGSIAPNSAKPTQFEVVQGVNIGTYEQDVYLTTDFGFEEKLKVTLNVSAPSPDWEVNPNDFQYSMSIIGQIKVDGIISTDANDKIVALVNDEVRGVANLEYYEDYDAYLVFMDVFSNQIQNENIVFNIWDASEGKTHIEVTPQLVFENNQLYGNPSNPTVFEAMNLISAPIAVTEGWNWISFNLNNPNHDDVNVILQGVSANDGDVIKDIRNYDQYATSTGWIGSITGTNGIDVRSTYKIKVSEDDTIHYYGSSIEPSSVKVAIDSGWNWIGFIAQKNVSVANAFGNYNVAHGDLLKGQTNFAIYDSILGWVGNLDFMVPNNGYMFQSSKRDTLTYPNSAIFRSGGKPSLEQQEINTQFNVRVQDYQYTMNIISSVSLCSGKVNPKYVVAKNNNDIIVGAGKVNENNQVYLTLYGSNTNEELKLYIVDEYQRTISTDIKIPFVSETIIGSPNQALKLDIPEESVACNNILSITEMENEIDKVELLTTYVTNEIVFNYQFNKQSDLTIELYGINGQFITTLFDQEQLDGENEIRWSTSSKNGSLSAGMYVVKMRFNGQIKSEKIIKQ